ncbi:ABC transporter ATP-binding protein [Bradyrhizobium sp. CCGB12]|uniref:ABC transporter ATP-binding protein n=1 Tax=Bradyrhizobium sp. CCGB12 TaxID=2949632 RepID=UPI0020B1B48F|nr:ATP-binding cassette domain-containing protein [Bradyrhizobium sp. CCGB12]MCP3387791.1 ABC transporter ATP-binding protein [Bradyrhizobium sp. CCGB12]
MSDLLVVDQLRVAYGKVEALFGVSLKVQKGQVISVIGPNGAGKSTLLNAVAGLLPCRGRISFQGEDINSSEGEERVENGLCLVPEKRELFGSMSVEDNVLLGGYPSRSLGKAVLKSRLDDVYSRFPRLKERRKQYAATLSGGERQMLAIGRALMCAPKLLMLDEPSLGLAPRIVKEVFQIVAALRAADVSILLIEQNARAALQVSDYAYVLENGEISMEGESAVLRDDRRIVETYLGMGHSYEDAGSGIQDDPPKRYASR